MHQENCISTGIDRVKGLEDQMLACLSYWKAAFAAATHCAITRFLGSAGGGDTVKYTKWRTTSSRCMDACML